MWSAAAFGLVVGFNPATGKAISVGDSAAPERRPKPDPTQKVVIIPALEPSETPPEIDGWLNDAVWARVPATTDFHQVRPTAFAAPSRRTVVRVVYDKHALYVAAQLDDDAEAVARAQRLQGRSFDFDDQFHVVLDTFHNGRTGYFFQVNPNGIRREALIENDAVYDDWVAIWRASARVTGTGWQVEMVIPFRSLAFDPTAERWGLNFGRVIPRRSEEIAWSSRGQDGWSMAPAVAGDGVGFRNLAQGLGLDIQTGLLLARRAVVENVTSFEPTVDAFYKPSPQLTVAATVNTDFSASEVDDRVVNLTRFSIAFPERRAFFIQDANLFSFGGLTVNARPYFSRRIGLDDEGRPLDIYGGLRAVARLGPVGLGLVSAVQDADGRPQWLSVLRGTVDLLSQSQAGLIATHRWGGGVGNQLVGADVLYRNQSEGTGELLAVRAWLQGSFDDLIGSDLAAGASMGFPNDRLSAELSCQHIGARFSPGLGFVNRTGIRRCDAFVRGRQRIPGGWLRRIEGRLDASVVTDLDHRLQSGRLAVSPLQLRSRAGDTLALTAVARQESLSERFEIADEIAIAPRTYHFITGELTVATAPTRPWAGAFRVAIGRFFDGDRLDLGGSFDGRFGAVRLEADYEQSTVRLPTGSFVTRVVRFGGDVAMTSSWAWLNRLQFDTVTGVVAVNSRLRWLPHAGQALVVVFDQALKRIDRQFETERLEVIARFNYTWRF